MRILHVIPTYYPATRYGGPIYSVHGLCRALVALGHEVHVMTTSVDGDRDSAVPLGVAVNVDGVRVWYYPSRAVRRLNFSLPLARALWSRVETFDIVHMHSVFLWPTLIAARVAHWSGVPYIVSPRGALVKELVAKKNRWLKTAWINLFERRTLGRAAAVHLTSESEHSALKRFRVALRRTFVIPNGVDVPGRETRSRATEVTTVLFVGRLSWEKGLDRLIRAMQVVKDARLVIAGNDDANYRPFLDTVVAQCRLEDRVVFVGHVTGVAKERLLREATVLVLASYSENFGNVVLEAMAYGCPVVVTPEVGLAEVVSRSGAGLVSEGDRESLGGAIQALLDDPERRTRCGKSGYDLVCREYAWHVVAASMARQYAQEVQVRRIRDASN
jgi:glycosyltransferase involved in cell wall biosynthesis